MSLVVTNPCMVAVRLCETQGGPAGAVRYASVWINRLSVDVDAESDPHMVLREGWLLVLDEGLRLLSEYVE